MRDLIIIISIVIIVFGGGYLAESYLENSENELLDMLSSLQKQIKIGDMTHLDEAYKFQEVWYESKPKWHILANHQEIDEIESEMKRFIEAYELKLKDEASLSATVIAFRINDMHKGEKFELVNIL